MLIAEVFNLPEKQWTPKDNQVSASILSVGQPKNDQYGYKQDIVLTDNANNVSQAMTVQTKYEDGLIQSNEVGQSKMWICKWYQGRQGKCLVGYTTTKRTMPQQQNQAYGAPQGNQGAQQAAQPSKQPATQLDAAADNYAREADTKARGMVRHGLVCAAIRAGMITIGDGGDHIGDVNYWTEFVMTGKAPPPPSRVPDDSQVPEWEH